MAIVDLDPSSVKAVDFRAPQDILAELPDEPPAKRVKVEHDHDDMLALWDVELRLDVSPFVAKSKVLQLDGLRSTEYGYIVETTTKRKRSFLSIGKHRIVELIPASPADEIIRAIARDAALRDGSTSRSAKSFRTTYPDHRLLRQLSIQNGILTLQSRVLVRPVTKWTDESILAASTHDHKVLQNLTYPEEDDELNISHFYAILKPPSPSEAKIESSVLRSNLMQYQHNSIAWMIARENGNGEHPTLWNSTLNDAGELVMIQRALGLLTHAEDTLPNIFAPLPGGLLCDEMGLGKTVEILGCILANPRPKFKSKWKYDDFSGRQVMPSSGTLVICPNAILLQWLAEIEKHSTLRAFHYRGSKRKGTTLDMLLEYDIIVSSYEILSQEVHLARAQVNQRKLRAAPQYEKPTCLLTQIEFWRVVMDEGQMISSGTSSAAEVACCIPRVNGWICSGTPAQDLKDLFGLVHFLRLMPIFGNRKLWDTIIHGPQAATNLANLFGPISARNTKTSVKDEVILPKQSTYIMNVEFLPIEETNFNDLLTRAYEEIGLTDSGQPRSGSWDNLEEWQVTAMTTWLVQLRQACTHPQIGTKNRRNAAKPLQSLQEVLDSMKETTHKSYQLNLRSWYITHLERARIIEYRGEKDDAIETLLKHIPNVVNETQERARLSEIADKMQLNLVKLKEATTSEANDLRSWRLVLHRYYFALGGSYFDKKNAAADDDKQKFEKLETQYYALAKDERSLVLSEAERDAMASVEALKRRVDTRDFVIIPEIKYSSHTSGIAMRSLLALQELTQALNVQAGQLDDWRELCIAKLCSKLADQSDDPTGEEYQEALDAQTDSHVYQELIRFSLKDRVRAITGTRDEFVEQEYKKAIVHIEDAEDLMRKGLELKNKVNPDLELGSLKSIRLELSETRSRLEARDGRISRTEWEIIQSVMKEIDSTISLQQKACDELEKEFEYLNKCYNERLEYYRQFQAISDSVEQFTVLKKEKPGKSRFDAFDDRLTAALRSKAATNLELEESDITEQERTKRVTARLTEVDRQIAQLDVAIATAKARIRYLDHLNDAKALGDLCVICQSTFDIGALTNCGHMYCKDCFSEWFRHHRSCPICKTVLSANQYNIISLNPIVSPEKTNNALSSKIFEHYSMPDEAVLKQIKETRIVRSYSSKIDTIVKHILTLPRHQKSVVYSNWVDVITVLHNALSENSIHAVELSASRTDFLDDPNCRVLLMSGKSKSAGLNLTHAQNLFLVEPLINPAIDLQLRGRIHRIGQTSETNVFQYLVSGTLESKILEQTIRKRSMIALPSSNIDAIDKTDVIALFVSNFGTLRDRETMLGLI